MEKYTKNLIFADWFRGKRMLVNFSGQDKKDKNKREKAHKEKKPYCLTVGENKEHPYCYLKVGFKHIIVGILDEYKRLGLEFSYVRYQPDSNNIFLNSTAYREYEGDTDTVIKTTEFNFTPEGESIICIMDYITNKKERKEEQINIDVSDLWYNYPEFGCYDELIYHNKFPMKLEEINNDKFPMKLKKIDLSKG